MRSPCVPDSLLDVIGVWQVPKTMAEDDMKGLPGKFSFATDWLTQYSILQRRALLQVRV